MKINSIKIDNIVIGQNHPALIVPEIGINHMGSLKKALRMVDLIKKSGAKCVKVQIHIPDEEMSYESKKIRPGNSKNSIYNVIKSNSLTLDEELKLKIYIEKKKLLYIATPFSFKAIDWIKKNKVKLIKIGSGEFNNEYFLKKVIELKKPIILSTGMQDDETIDKNYKLLKKNNCKFILLHCHSVYPTDPRNANLNRINLLKKNFNDALIGYSDHTKGTDIACASLTYKPVLIEKHFAFNKKDKGPDIICSIDKKDLEFLINASKNVFLSINSKTKDIKNESITKRFAFQSVVAKKLIQKNEYFTHDNTILKRPGNGDFNSNNYKDLIGKKSNNIIKNNTQIKKTDVSS